MLFIATLSHEPADCWARPENERRAREWIAELPERADRHDVDLRGAYVTPTEHTFYIVVEAEDYAAAASFLGGALLEDHDGEIAPILPLEEGRSVLFED